MVSYAVRDARPHPEERACASASANSNAHARVSKDEDGHRTAPHASRRIAALRGGGRVCASICAAMLLSMRARASGAFWPNEPNASHSGRPREGHPATHSASQTRVNALLPSRGTPLRGPMITRRWLWVPALAALGRDDDPVGFVKNQPAGVGKDRRLRSVVLGLFFTMKNATFTCRAWSDVTAHSRMQKPREPNLTNPSIAEPRRTKLREAVSNAGALD